MTEVYLTIKEVADRLQMYHPPVKAKSHDSAARRLFTTLPGAFKIGKGWRISEKDFEAYIDSLKIKTGG